MKRWVLMMFVLCAMLNIVSGVAEEGTVWLETINYDQLREINGILHYVSDDGETSVPVEEEGITWLKEEAADSSIWFGLDNGDCQFSQTSRFWVQQLQFPEKPSEWNSLIKRMDTKYHDSFEKGQHMLFDVGVQKPDGFSQYTDIEKTKLYVQLEDQWDVENLSALYISADTDEEILIHTKEMSYPEGHALFGVMELRHFSPYAIYDGLSSLANTPHPTAPVVTPDNTTVPPQTGDEAKLMLWTLFAMGSATVLLLGFVYKKG